MWRALCNLLHSNAYIHQINELNFNKVIIRFCIIKECKLRTKIIVQYIQLCA